MNDLKIFCLSLNNSHLKKILDLNYIPVGLGEGNFSDQWMNDFGKNNIHHKNKFYGEYTFHYKLWKNNTNIFENCNWVGFCSYRRFWSQQEKKIDNFKLKDDAIKSAPKHWENFDTVLVEPILTNITKLSKIIKHGKKIILKNPSIFFNKKKITIKTHFDMYHGHGNLDRAIELLNKDDRDDFNEFVNTQTQFNPYNMFICNSKKIIFNYYSALFPWLEECEKKFGFDFSPNDYGKIRIYGFLAERYLSFWFNKYSNTINWPVYFNDIT